MVTEVERQSDGAPYTFIVRRWTFDRLNAVTVFGDDYDKCLNQINWFFDQRAKGAVNADRNINL